MKDIGPMILLYDWISKGNVVGDSWVNDVVCYSNGADRDDHVVVCYSNEGEQDERAVAKARQHASRLPVEVP